MVMAHGQSRKVNRVAHHGIAKVKFALASMLLAAGGLTGPEEIFEGAAGWAATVAGDVDFRRLTAPVGERYRILDTCLKPYAAVAGAMAPIRAAIDLAAQEKFKVTDIESVVIKLHALAVRKATDPRKVYPRDKETADHSYHYCVAAALLDGACGPAQFTDQRIAADDIRELIGKTTLVDDPALTALYPRSSGGAVSVKFNDGRELARTCSYPPGHPQNPLTDDELARKFLELSDGMLRPGAAQRVIDSVMAFERCENVGSVLSHMIAV